MNLKTYIARDGIGYFPFLSKGYIIEWLVKSEQYYIREYLFLLRKEEYFTFIRPNKLLKYYYQAGKNRLGAKLGFFISAGCFDAGLKIWHSGSIIVNPKSRIGKNCNLHGNCCIGSKVGFPDDLPVIGDNVDIGQNAQVLGGITIADGVKIGAGAVVVKSVLEEGVTVVGVPGKIISRD